MTKDIVSDNELLGHVLDIIEALLDQLRDEVDLLTRAYKQRAADLESAESSLRNDISDENANILDAQSQIAGL
jgi:hypothetical protein